MFAQQPQVHRSPVNSNDAGVAVTRKPLALDCYEMPAAPLALTGDGIDACPVVPPSPLPYYLQSHVPRPMDGAG